MAKVYDTATDIITFARLQSQNTTSGSSYLGSDGLLKFAAEDEPRIEYGSDGSLKGLLIEEQRTNLLTHSVPDSTNWDTSIIGTGQTPVFTENSAVAPDGTSTATKIEFDVGGGTTSSDRSLVLSPVVTSITSGSAYTASVWLKGANGGEVLILRHVGESTYSEITLTSGWSRYDLTETSVDTSTVINLGLKGNQTGQTAIVYAWGAQLEEGSFPTSYIPTSGSQQTRSADVASIPVSAFGHNPDAGTIVVEFDYQFADGESGFPRPFEYGNQNTAVNRITVFTKSENGDLRYEARTNNSGTGVTIETATGSPVSGKAAVAFEDGNTAACFNGGSAVTGSHTVTGASDPRDIIKIGGQAPNTSSNINGHIKSIQYYPRRLTNTQLQELTA